MNTDVSLSFNEKHSLAIRIWHWTFFLFILAQLVTVLLASTVFRTRNTISLVQGTLQEKGLTASNDQARAVAHAYSDKLWMLHTYVGYFLCTFLLARIVIELAQPGEEKLGRKIRRAIGMPSTQEEKQHYLMVKRGYVLFYCLIAIMAITGLVLAFEDVPFFHEIHSTAKQVHGFVQYFIYGYILFHLAGVIRADLGKHRGIVSGMIHGKKHV